MTTLISHLELTVRTCNQLLNQRITMVEQLPADLTELDLTPRGLRDLREALAIHQNHLDRQIQPQLWQFVLANKEAFELLRQGRATIHLNIQLTDPQP